jgi:polyhydroxyalkanoate synthesis regulator phasin
VALAAIQGLYEIVKEKDVKIVAQQQRIDSQQEQITVLEARLAALEARMK